MCMSLDGFSDGFLISVKWIRRFNCFGCYNFFLQFTFKAITNNNNERMNKQTSDRMKNRKIEKNKRWHTAFVCESFASRKKKTSTQSNAESAWCAAHKSPNMKLHLRLPLSLPHFASVCGYLILFLRCFFSLFIHFFFSSFDLHLQLQFAFIFVGLSGILLREYYVFLIQYILLRNKRCEGQWQWKPIDCLSHFGCCEFALFQLIWLIKSILRCLSLKVEVIFAFFLFRTTNW